MKSRLAIAGRRFQFRPVLTGFSVIGLAVLIWLGTWQLNRLQWKLDLIAQVDARVNAEPVPFAEAQRRAAAGEDMEYAPVRAAGRLRADLAAQVFGSYEGRAGHYLFVPLEVSPQGVVYVNLGFTPQVMAGTDNVAALNTQEAVIEGLFRGAETPAPPASWFVSTEQSSDGLWFVRDPALFAAKAGVDAAPYYIDRFAVAGAQWPKGGTTRLDFSNRHLEYALTWFGLAATLVGVWLAFSLPKSEKVNNFKK